RRFKLEEMIPRLGYAAVRTPPMPQRLLSMAEARG
ncbi:MAG: IS1595 family transposase, partial [gamma proteobacterium endosymbiont of Lamellibrachia anaximandri]|nr:IS1595 family transposase [gamma proteobacterium endosymbiont of Lamellibrachia anaximandri]